MFISHDALDGKMAGKGLRIARETCAQVDLFSSAGRFPFYDGDMCWPTWGTGMSAPLDTDPCLKLPGFNSSRLMLQADVCMTSLTSYGSLTWLTFSTAKQR